MKVGELKAHAKPQRRKGNKVVKSLLEVRSH